MLQVTSAFASLVNGGSYYRPHVVKEIQSESGSVIQSISKELVRTTVSEQTTQTILSALEQTVTSGTGTKAAVDGYRIGGKTGTAEKLPRGSGKYVVSFIGFAPVEDPQVVVYVVIDELQDNQEDSSAPTKMAGDILREVLPYLQIFPEGSENGETGETDLGNYQWGAVPETDADGNPVESDETEGGNTSGSSGTQDMEDFLSQWVDEDGDGYDDITGDYYWDDLAEYMEQNGIN